MAEGLMPNLTSEVANTALVEATAMSQAEARPMPPPSAAPCTRAMVGFFISAMVRSILARPRASLRFSSMPLLAARRIQLRSAPAEKLLPRPARTADRTSASASRATKAAVSSEIRVSSKALWRSGRFIQTVATGPFSSISRAVNMRCSLHPEDAELGFFGRGVHRGGEAQAEHAAGVGRIDDAVVPEAGGGVVGVALGLVLLADRRLEGFFLFGAPGLAAGFEAIALDGGEHAGRLFAAHHRDAGIRPHPQETRAVGAAAHAVVAGAEGAANDHGEFRHLGRGDGGHHLGPVTGDAAVFIFLADHEAGDILQEDERNAALGAEFDEVRAFLGRFGEQDAVVGDDADRIAPDAGKAADQCGAVARLEFVEIGTIDDAGDDLAHVEGLLGIGREHDVEL